jgi:hypothetical protein
MAQTVIRARESTANIAAGVIERYVDREIARLTPDAAPLTVLMRQLKSKSIPSTKPEHFEKDLPARWDQVNNGAGYTAGDTAIVVDNAAYFSVSDVFNVPRTAEHIRVTAVTTATNTLTVSRAVGSTSAAALVDNDDLQILGPSFAEGAALGSEKSHQPTNPFNYTEIVRTPFGETESERQSQTYVGGEKEMMAEKLVEHMIDIERKMWFGERNLDTSDTAKPRRYMGGVLYWATSNIKDFGALMTEPELEDWLQDVFSYTASGESRTLFASPDWITELDQLAAGRIQTVSDRNATFGIAVKQWITGHGALNIVKNRLFENGAGGQGYGEYAVALDTGKLTYVYLGDRNTKLRKNVGDPGDDGYTHEYLTECCLLFKNKEVHGIGKNIV